MAGPEAHPSTPATESVNAKTENDARVIERVAHALEAAQEDLASIGGSLAAGARDLREDLQRRLRDSRRDLKKMSNALQRDLGRLQKDLTKTTGTNVHARAAAPKAGKTTRPKASAASR